MITESEKLRSELHIACMQFPKLVKQKKISGKLASNEIQRLIIQIRSCQQNQA